MTMPTFTDGKLVRQGDLNHLPTAMDSLALLLTGAIPPKTYTPMVAVSMNTPHLVANNLDTVQTWNVANINNDGMWSAGLSDTIVIQTGGVYLAWGQAHFAANSSGVRSIQILVNGKLVPYNVIAGGSANGVGTGEGNAIPALMPPLLLAPGATLYLSAFQNSGVGLNLDINNSGTFFCVARIGN